MKNLVGLLMGLVLLCCSCQDKSSAKENKQEFSEEINKGDDFKVIAYWTGSNNKIDPNTVLQLDQIIYSFSHLEENTLKITKKDSSYIQYVTSLKKIKPNLKVLISLGGWGGCETCSEVFSTEKARKEFAISVKTILKDYKVDGIDLDWEYPAIEGFPGHPFKLEDRQNFTLLIKELRNVLGQGAVISFAAGGFKEYLQKSVDWNNVMPLVDHVNIMSYDMVNGGSSKTGHHTSLYSTKTQRISTHNTVKYLDSIGVPHKKMIIGAAFYARVFEQVGDSLNGLYQIGKFKESILFKDLDTYVKSSPGFDYFWDSEAQSPYIYNAEKALFVTYDDSLSISGKTKYALENELGGIMFWQLSGDKPNGLLNVIDNEIKNLKIN
ncbi:glycosyl hydrolase family 18 protein [Gramella sp. AN32]|uniref:chitinase n=1 Tax=Christiangramia antarctica TaxID=2058158 RepID=A0ABW5X2S5_9FLAO|nr:glycosyl hydrolase family 18 protein [Gramella sp. AN32]MCM4154978.1 glycoside hydrolase [Gramella sp. AN32]